MDKCPLLTAEQMNILQSWCGAYHARTDIAGLLGQKERNISLYMVFWSVTFGGISQAQRNRWPFSCFSRFSAVSPDFQNSISCERKWAIGLFNIRPKRFKPPIRWQWHGFQRYACKLITPALSVLPDGHSLESARRWRKRYRRNSKSTGKSTSRNAGRKASRGKRN